MLALVLFLSGAGLYARSWLGMRELRDRAADADAGAPLFAAMARFDHFWMLSRIGVWLVMAAVGVAVLAAVAAVIHDRREETPAS